MYAKIITKKYTIAFTQHTNKHAKGENMWGVAYFLGKNLYGIGIGEMLINVKGGTPVCHTSICNPLLTFSFVKKCINLISKKNNTLVK